MDQSNLVCSVIRIGFDLKALETTLTENMELNVRLMALHLFE